MDGTAVTVRGTISSGGSTALSAAIRSCAGANVKSSPSSRRQSKKNGRSGSFARVAATSSLRPNRRMVTWNGCGLSVRTERHRLAIEDRVGHRQRAHRLDDLRNGVR